MMMTMMMIMIMMIMAYSHLLGIWLGEICWQAMMTIKRMRMIDDENSHKTLPSMNHSTNGSDHHLSEIQQSDSSQEHFHWHLTIKEESNVQFSDLTKSQTWIFPMVEICTRILMSILRRLTT